MRRFTILFIALALPISLSASEPEVSVGLTKNEPTALAAGLASNGNQSLRPEASANVSGKKGSSSAPLSAGVRILRSQPAQPENIKPDEMQEEPTTVVQGLLPQYRSTDAFESDGAQAPDPEENSLRFLLALPDRRSSEPRRVSGRALAHGPWPYGQRLTVPDGRLLLLEALITIDGQPFEMVREQRIDRLLAELQKTSAEDPEPSPPASPSIDAADEEPSSPDESADESPDESADETSQANVVPAPIPSASLDARLGRYARVTGRPPTRAETRWLLTKWVDGPVLLMLDENFQRYRGSQTPAFDVLDIDIDGTISPSELSAAEQTLLSCDVNQNDVVEFTEIAEVADDPRHTPTEPARPSLIPIADATKAAKALRRLDKRDISAASVARFDTDADGRLDESEISKLHAMEPDLIVTVSFDSKDAAKSEIRVGQVSSRLSAKRIRNAARSITIPAGKTMLEFSAVQSDALSGSDQVSIGIINDGYPLLPALDPNDDGRLTIRELRTVSDHLQRFDANQDNALSSDEVSSTVRVAIGLGPTVHRHLADIRSVHAPARAPQVSPPDWFTRMDGNKDGDLSSREFLFDADKFEQMDADQDGLISPAEAVQAVAEQSRPEIQNTKSTQEEATLSP